AQEIAVSAPAGATLSPAFSPEIHRYALTVPDSCSQVWLKVNTANHAAASANRHTLQAAGSDTVITVHVTSADRKSTSDYTVVVHRLAPQGNSTPAFSGRKAKSAGIAGAKTAHKTAVSKSCTKSQKKSLNRKTTSAGKKSTSKKSINKKSASKQGKNERYTPSAASYAENLHGQQMNVTGTDGFSGFQSGMLVFFLIAAAALAAILGTRAWCRRHSNQTESEDELSKNKGQEAKDPQQKQK
ncbi:MAG: cadherin-like beta sandwich domain-containing protein, partial [Oscillospiraceae bacterium]|nr:cadherin-like beta sandwich domain-containing protein [Oscillospiraceae bacterium]